jgi:hypothetical protein
MGGTEFVQPFHGSVLVCLPVDAWRWVLAQPLLILVAGDDVDVGPRDEVVQPLREIVGRSSWVVRDENEIVQGLHDVLMQSYVGVGGGDEVVRRLRALERERRELVGGDETNVAASEEDEGRVTSGGTGHRLAQLAQIARATAPISAASA